MIFNKLLYRISLQELSEDNEVRREATKYE